MGNTCPGGTLAVSSASQCVVAGTALGYSNYGSAVNLKNSPGGCFYDGKNAVFNQAAGSAKPGNTPICKQAPPYRLGTDNTNTCPGGTLAVSSASQCVAAGTALGYSN